MNYDDGPFSDEAPYSFDQNYIEWLTADLRKEDPTLSAADAARAAESHWIRGLTFSLQNIDPTMQDADCLGIAAQLLNYRHVSAHAVAGAWFKHYGPRHEHLTRDPDQDLFVPAPCSLDRIAG